MVTALGLSCFILLARREMEIFPWMNTALIGTGVLLLMAGAGFGVFRWAGMAFDPPVAVAVLLQVLHAASYGMTHLGTIYYVRRFMDADFAGTAQGVFGAISGGVFMTCAIALAGWSYGAHAALSYLWMAAMCGVALMLGVVLNARTNG